MKIVDYLIKKDNDLSFKVSAEVKNSSRLPLFNECDQKQFVLLNLQTASTRTSGEYVHSQERGIAIVS